MATIGRPSPEGQDQSGEETWTTDAVSGDQPRTKQTTELFSDYRKHLKLEYKRGKQAHYQRARIFQFSLRLVRWLTIGIGGLILLDYVLSQFCGKQRLPDAVYVAFFSTLVIQTIGVFLVIVKYVFSAATISEFLRNLGNSESD